MMKPERRRPDQRCSGKPRMTVDDHQTEMRASETEGSVGPRLEERFRTLVEHIPGVATYLDRVLDDPAHSEPLYISPQVEDMFGDPVAEGPRGGGGWAA